MKKNKPRGHPRPPKPSPKPRFSKELVILYEDDAVAAINKPAGLLAVPVEGSDSPSAWSLLSAELKAKRQRAFVVHRIDRFTSGILLFAKTPADRDILVKQFLSHAPLRQYTAAVRGRPAAKEKSLVHYFRRAGMFQHLSAAHDPKAARAELHYVVEQPLKDAALVRVTLVTGLQNQIRAQLAALGHPVIGDRKYSWRESAERRIARVALHAGRLQFIHPRSGQSIRVECAIPSDMRSLIQGLRMGSR